MSDVSFEQVKEYFNEQGWDITDEWTPDADGAGSWSVTARAGNDVRISIDEPPEDIDLNNIIIESKLQQLSGIDEYDKAISIADEYENVWVQGSSAEGLYQRADASGDIDMTKREIVERLEAKDVPFGVRFLVTKSSSNVALDAVSGFVEAVQSAQYTLNN